jgi:hypothetical protein
MPETLYGFAARAATPRAEKHSIDGCVTKWGART